MSDMTNFDCCACNHKWRALPTCRVCRKCRSTEIAMEVFPTDRERQVDDFDLFDDTMKQICEAVAAGVEHRVQVSGVDPVVQEQSGYRRAGMNESVMEDAAYEWCCAQGRRVARQIRLQVDGRVKKIVDMGIYHQDREFGLIELKRYAIGKDSAEEDRSKLLPLLNPTWRFGAVCFLHADKPDAYLSKLHDMAVNAGDTWHCVEFPLPTHVKAEFAKYYICARCFQ